MGQKPLNCAFVFYNFNLIFFFCGFSKKKKKKKDNILWKCDWLKVYGTDIPKKSILIVIVCLSDRFTAGGGK